MVNLLCVHNSKQIRDCDMLRTAGLTVAAGGTVNQVHGTEDLLYPAYRFQFLIRQGLKVLHKANIILHLHHIAHTGKNHHDPFKTGGKTNRVASRTPTL